MTCTKCDDSCTTCDVEATKCITCKKEHLNADENGKCVVCDNGYYYDKFQKICVAVTSSLGFAESELGCKVDGVVTECSKVEASATNVETFEKPLKCDTSITGVAIDPVGEKCVCGYGYYDNRSETEIKANPLPVCTEFRELTGDDFCKHGGKNEKGDDFVCTVCNADYLELKNGRCVCKDTHYTTSWGMCVPCYRHNKGCKTCSGKYVCKECENGYKLVEDGKKVTCVAQ